MGELTLFIAQTVANAYAMCSNQTNAAPETHATLIATLVVESGSIVVASPTAVSSSIQSSSSIASSTSMVVTPTPSAATSSSTPSNTAAATTSTKSSLSSAQIGGIAAGCAAVAILAALLALFLLLRRRQGFARMRDSWSPKRSQGSPGSLPISAPQYKEPKMMSFTRALARRGTSSRYDARPGTIGLAISPRGPSSDMHGAARMPGGGVDGIQAAAEGIHPLGQRLVVRNMGPSPPAKDAAPSSPPAPPVPPMSPRRAVSSFRFFPEDDQALPPTPLPTTHALHSQPKPTLTVAIPPARPKRQSTASTNHMPFHGTRDSVVTEFAEDGEDSAIGPGSAQIWRPPTTDPASAATYYVADKWGNWVLGGGDASAVVQEPIAELATPLSKTLEEREAELRQQREAEQPVKDSNAVKAALRELSSPTIPEAVALGGSSMSKARTGKSSRGSGAPGRSTIRLVTPDSGRLPMNSRSSSVYSSYTLPLYVAPTAENPLPVSDASTASAEAFYAGKDSFARGGSGKGSRRRRSKPEDAVGGRRPPERQMSRDSAATIMSQDSATTIADSPVEDARSVMDSFPLPKRRSSLPQQQPLQQQGSLSPVVESPGRSPVTYPNIPRPQSSKRRKSTGKRPLPHPNVARMQQQGQPFHDSPTLGAIDAVRPVHVGAHDRKGSLNPYPDRNPGQVRTGSPNMQGPDEITVLKQRTTDRARLPSQSQSRYGPLSIYDAYNDPSRPVSIQPPPSMYVSPPQTYEPSPQTQQNDVFPQPPTFMPSPPSATDADASAGYHSPSAVRSPKQQTYNKPSGPTGIGFTGDGASSSSNNSGLLAKRLGAERAAGLQIASTSGRAPMQGWAKRSSSQNGARALTPPPQSVAVRGVGPAGPQHGAGNDERETYVQLPSTPGWKPQLTPKKRGDDLYLSVM